MTSSPEVVRLKLGLGKKLGNATWLFVGLPAMIIRHNNIPASINLVNLSFIITPPLYFTLSYYCEEILQILFVRAKDGASFARYVIERPEGLRRRVTTFIFSPMLQTLC